MKLTPLLIIVLVIMSSLTVMGLGFTFGHNAGQILINYNGERTLQEVISLNLHSAPAVIGCGGNTCFNGVKNDGTAKCIEIQTFDKYGVQYPASATDFTKKNPPDVYEFQGNEIEGKNIISPGTTYGGTTYTPIIGPDFDPLVGKNIDTNNDNVVDILDMDSDNYYEFWDLDYDWNGEVSIFENEEAGFEKLFEAYSDADWKKSQVNNYANMQYVLLDAFEQMQRVDDGNGVTKRMNLGSKTGDSFINNIVWDVSNLEDSYGDMNIKGQGNIPVFRIFMDMNNQTQNLNKELSKYYYASDDPNFVVKMDARMSSNKCEVTTTDCGVDQTYRLNSDNLTQCKTVAENKMKSICSPIYPFLKASDATWTNTHDGKIIYTK